MSANNPALFSSYQGLFASPTSAAKGQENSVFNAKLCDITQMWLSDSERGECYLTSQVTSTRESIDKRFASSCLLLRRNVYPSPRPPELQLEIQSDLLQAVFQKAITGVRTINVYASPIIVRAPYHELYHFRTEIAEACSAPGWTDAQSERLQRELKVLNEFTNENLGAAIVEAEALMAVGNITSLCLWSIYKPGEAVILSRQVPGGRFEMFCGILQVAQSARRPDNTPVWSVTIRYMGFEGNRFGAVEDVYEFPLFAGQQAITSLPIYPLSYSPAREAIVTELQARGRTFVNLCQDIQQKTSNGHRGYNGPVWVQREQRWKVDGCEFFDAPERTIVGRVMVDPEGFKDETSVFRKRIVAGSLLETRRTQSYPTRQTRSGDSDDDIEVIETKLDEVSLVDPSSLTNTELMTFPSRIAGYSLVTKDAGFFLVDCFHPVKWETSWTKHILSTSPNMQSILRIASGFAHLSQQFDYGIEAKGRGLVILLYGPSGCGKTLTAECVAEGLHLPLYRVSGGDLGTNSYEAENQLIKAFNRTSRWGAIMLFDESDAFMSQRRDDSLERNALVAVLLRLLEYQKGIIMLTTNRRDDFDEAFNTRIHVSIEYQALKEKERESIWRWEFKKSQWAEDSLSASDFRDLGRLGLDGRSIKNAFHVLKLSMSATGKSTVSLSDLKEVLDFATGNLRPEARKQVLEFCRT